MLLVFIMLGIFLLLAVVVIIVLMSTIKIKIENVKIDSQKKGEVICSDFKIKIQLYIFHKIKIVSFTITKEKLKKSYEKVKKNTKIEELQKTWEKEIPKKRMIEAVKRLRIKWELIQLEIALGIAEDAPLTSILVGIISAVLGVLLANKEYQENCYFLVTPVYIGKDLVNVSLDSIFCIKMVHIIYSIYFLRKGRKEKDERTSNRKFDEYGYERY